MCSCGEAAARETCWSSTQEKILVSWFRDSYFFLRKCYFGVENMKKTLSAAIAAISFGTISHAATIDLTDNSFTSVTYQTFVQGPLGPIVEFTETVAGVDFDFQAAGQFRAVGTWGNGTSAAQGPWALTFGGGGGNTTSFTLTASEDVILESFSGFAQQFITGAIFDVTGGTVSSTGNQFSTSAFLATGTPVTDLFVGGPLYLDAGVTYSFTTTNAGAATQSHMTSLEFTKVDTTVVPLPAGLPLLLTGIVGIALLRRRQQS
jgi:hypothetical protein